MTDHVEIELRALLAERAAAIEPAAGNPVPGDPVALVTARMRHRSHHRHVLSACAATLAVVVIAGGVSLAARNHPSSRPSAPTPVTPAPVTPPSGGSPLQAPTSIAADENGHLYIAASNRIWQASRADGAARAVAGTGIAGFSGDGGPSTRALIDTPRGIAVARDGTVYFGDTGNSRIRAISPSGIIRTVARVDGVQALAIGPDGDLYVAAAEEVDRISDNGTKKVLLHATQDATQPSHEPTFPAGLSPRALNPSALAFDSAGNLYIANFSPKLVLRLTPAGVLTIAVPSVYVSPGGLAQMPDGSVLISDYGNFSIDQLSDGQLTEITDFATSSKAFPGHVRPGASAVSADGTVYMLNSEAADPAASVLVKPPNRSWVALPLSTAVPFDQDTASLRAPRS